MNLDNKLKSSETKVLNSNKLKFFHKNLNITKKYLVHNNVYSFVFNVISSSNHLQNCCVIRIIVFILESILGGIYIYFNNTYWEPNVGKPISTLGLSTFSQPFIYLFIYFIFLTSKTCFDSYFSYLISNQITNIIVRKVVYSKPKYFDQIQASTISESFSEMVDTVVDFVKINFEIITNLINMINRLFALPSLFFASVNQKRVTDFLHGTILLKLHTPTLDTFKITLLNTLGQVAMCCYINIGSIIILSIIFMFVMKIFSQICSKKFQIYKKAYLYFLKLFSEIIDNNNTIAHHSLHNKISKLLNKLIIKMKNLKFEAIVAENIINCIRSFYILIVIMLNGITFLFIDSVSYNKTTSILQYNKILYYDEKHIIQNMSGDVLHDIYISKLSALNKNINVNFHNTIKLFLEAIYSFGTPLTENSNNNTRLKTAAYLLRFMTEKITSSTKKKKEDQKDEKFNTELGNEHYYNSYHYYKNNYTKSSEHYHAHIAKENDLCFPYCKQQLYFDQDYHLYVKNLNINLGNIQVLKNINFDLSSKSNIYLVGTSGSGKSVLLNILTCRYEDYTGEIYLERRKNNILQETIYKDKINSCCWNIHFNFMQQKSQLLTLTIKDNIELLQHIRNTKNINYDWFDYVTAAKLSISHDFVNNLPKKYESIANQDVIFSGGQQQRICLAKLFSVKTIFYILDEVTSALDKLSAKLVTQNIKHYISQGKIIITHNLLEIENNDLVIFLHQGNIIDISTHEKLQQINIQYNNLVMSKIDDN